MNLFFPRDAKNAYENTNWSQAASKRPRGPLKTTPGGGPKRPQPVLKKYKIHYTVYKNRVNHDPPGVQAFNLLLAACFLAAHAFKTAPSMA